MSIRLTLALLLLTSTGAQGLDTEFERATLRGLNGVQVVVEDMAPDIVRDGLTRQQLQTDVELRLRKAGIRVLTAEEHQRALGRPWLYVRVSTSQPSGLSSYSFAIEAELYQDTYLARNPDRTVSAATWSPAGRIGTMGTDRMFALFPRESFADSAQRAGRRCHGISCRAGLTSGWHW
jgi:hypothetical protein